MPAKDQAAYMRDYRAKKAPEKRSAADVERIAELEEEVARLKRQLAARTIPAPMVSQVNAISAGSGPIQRGVGGFNTRPFSPAPKTTPHR